MLDVTGTRARIGLDAAHRQLARTLRNGGVKTASLDARLLLQHACAIEQADLIRDPKRLLTDQELRRLRYGAAQRLSGEPVARIIGIRGFWGLEFRLSSQTLDPRPDTETLVEAVLVALRGRAQDPLRLLDLGTGSGCILTALLRELPRATGVGTDVSHAALCTARENALRNGVGDRVRFVQANWLHGLCGPVDVVVSNPPYIASEDLGLLSREVRDYDPTLALDGGADGLDAYRAISGDLPRVLKTGGIAAFEVGHRQSEAVGEMLVTAGLAPALPGGGACMSDLAGIERAVVVRKAEIGENAKKRVGMPSYSR